MQDRKYLFTHLSKTLAYKPLMTTIALNDRRCFLAGIVRVAVLKPLD